MDHIPRGQALIINITQIDGMASRKGSDIDAANLRTLLQNLHFSVSMYDGKNMTATVSIFSYFIFFQIDIVIKHITEILFFQIDIVIKHD